MICQRCSRLLSPSLLPLTALRPLSTSSRLLHPESPPPATSTSAAQPFSTPFTPSPAKTPGIPSSPSTTPTAASQAHGRPPSSVPAGTALKGIAYIKGQEVLAKEDSEYPEWLWGLLDPTEGDSVQEEQVGDAFAKSKKQRRLASKAARALRAGSADAAAYEEVPLEEQSIDLPAGMGEEESRAALEARDKLRKAMRQARRKKIKEDNFLRGMR